MIKQVSTKVISIIVIFFTVLVESATLSAQNNSARRIAGETHEDSVIVAYGVQKESDISGSIASVSADDMKNLSATDAAAALQGKASGVHIISDGAPGAGAEIRVRGYSSSPVNNTPLLIVDGLHVSSISYLDPSMIESVTVLKDAASAAIYGAEAGNGAVLITTKKGQNGKTYVSYSGKAILQDKHKRIMMDRDGLIGYLGLEYGDDWVDARIKNFDYSHPMYEGGVIDQDWTDAYTEPTWSQHHSLSFSGGNNAGRFFASLNYLDNNGIVKGDKDMYSRLTAQVNADYQIFKWLHVGTNNSIEKWSSKSVSQRGYSSSFESMLLMDPLTPVYWTKRDEMSLAAGTMYDKVMAGDPSVRPYRFLGDENGWFANSKYSDIEGSPLAKRDASDSYRDGFNVNGTIFANLTPVKGLTITSRFGYRISQNTYHSYTAPYYIGERGSQDNYSISATANTGYYYQWENFANYMLNLRKHSFNAMAGMSYRGIGNDNVSASASGPDILSAYEPQFQYLNYVKNDALKNISNIPVKSASLAYFGRLMYSYDSRYSVQASFRADEIDYPKLSKSSRWIYFPSVSAGWTLSNESFIKDIVGKDALSLLKLRASWGSSGNISVFHNGLPDTDFILETSKQIDLGLDARFLSGSLALAADYFNKTAESDADRASLNSSTVLNSGIELDLGWKDTTGDFSYEISGNITYIHNEVLALPGDTPRITSSDAASTNYHIQTALEPGYPVWYLRGYEYDSATENIVDQDNNGFINDSDKVYLGKGTPDWLFGLNVNLAWKGIDFSVIGSGTAGSSIMPVLHRNGFVNHLKAYTDLYENGTYPHPSKTAGNYQFWSSSANIFKGDYFRIRQMQLGYTLPEQISRKVLMKQFRVYVSLDDFITFTKYPGLDPETAYINSTSGAGLDWGSYPTMQKVVFGVNITF